MDNIKQINKSPDLINLQGINVDYQEGQDPSSVLQNQLTMKHIDPYES